MSVEFAYARARAQSRHGDRLPASQWRLLDSSRGLPQYLHLVRGTVLAPRVQHFSATTSPHAIERSLRRDWRAEVASAAHWVPGRWRAAVQWIAWLSDLPAMDHLLDGGDVLPWMSKDPVLSEFAVEDADARRAAIEASKLGPVLAGNGGDGLLDAWLRHWLLLWPADDISRAGLQELVELLHRDRNAAREAGKNRVARRERRERLESRVIRIMRKGRGDVVVIFCHLLLTALELQRLRDGLLRRALFNDVIAGVRT